MFMVLYFSKQMQPDKYKGAIRLANNYIVIIKACFQAVDIFNALFLDEDLNELSYWRNLSRI